MSIEIKTVFVNDFSMDYFSFGAGERTLVILPGLSVKSVMLSAETIAKEYEIFRDDYTVYVFDRRRELPPEYRVTEMARDTAEAFIKLGLSDIYLFGASQGGMMAMTIAIEYPGLISALALGSTSPYVDPERGRALDLWIDLARRRDGSGLYLSFGKKLYTEEMFTLFEKMLENSGKTVTDEEFDRFCVFAEGARGFDVRERLCEISCPTLAIGAADDEVLGADATALIAEKMKNNRDFLMYMYGEGYGHAAYDTAPDYRRRLYDFFANN